MKRSENGSSNVTVFLLFIIVLMAGAWMGPTVVDGFVGAANKEVKLEKLEQQIAELEKERDAIKDELGETPVDPSVVQMSAKSSPEERQKVPMAPPPPKFAAAKKEGPILRLVKKEDVKTHNALETKDVEVAKVPRGDYEDLSE